MKYKDIVYNIKDKNFEKIYLLYGKEHYLIDNAIKYNEKNTTLSVMSRKFNDRIEIRIFDDGRGINEEIRELIRELNK